MNRRTLLNSALGMLSLLSLPGCGDSNNKKKKLNIYIWPEYLPDGVIEAFKALSGAEVIVGTFTSNEEMIAKIAGGGSGYDIVCPSDYAVTTMIRQSLLEPLEKSKIPGLANLAAEYSQPKYDEGMKFSLPFQVGSTSLGFNKKTGGTPPKKWSDLFEPARLEAWKGKISLIDDPKEGFAPAFLALGLSPNSKNPDDLAQALELTRKIKPYLASFDSETFEDTLLEGKTVLTHGYSGDFGAALSENPDLDYIIPEEGCVVAVDNLAILKESLNKELAHQFLDFICTPKIAGQIASGTGYVPCNGKALEFVDEATKNSPTFVLPPPDRRFTLENLGEDGEAARAEAWEKLKTQ